MYVCIYICQHKLKSGGVLEAQWQKCWTADERDRTPVALSRSLLDKYPWESYGLKSITTVLLQV